MERNGETPLVSVIMAAYNAVTYIKAAIQSVQAQTVTDWELLVIDDGSKDETAALVSELARQDSRIRPISNAQNMGTARSRNRGLDLARGQYVAFLDSDDQWYPDKLEKQLILAKEKNADIVYASYAIVDEQGNKRCPDFVVPEAVDMKSMLIRNDIGCSTVMLSGAMVEKYHFCPDYYHEDYALWLEMLKAGAVAVGVTDVLVDYRYHSSSRAANKIGSAKCRWRVYRDALGMNVITSSWYLMQYAFGGIWKYRKK